jgi:dimethylamine corrinoid protein
MDFEKLKNAMADLEEDSVLEMMNELMKDGGEYAGKAMEACQEGMHIIGDRFEN